MGDRHVPNGMGGLYVSPYLLRPLRRLADVKEQEQEHDDTDPPVVKKTPANDPGHSAGK